MKVYTRLKRWGTCGSSEGQYSHECWGEHQGAQRTQSSGALWLWSVTVREKRVMRCFQGDLFPEKNGREFGGKEVDISKQKQKWWSTALMFLNAFQILEKQQHLDCKIITDSWRDQSCGQSSPQVTSKHHAEKIQAYLWALPGHRACFPMLARLWLSRDGTQAAALISSAVIFLELSRVFLPFFSSLTEKHVMLFNVTSQISHHFNFFQGEPPHTATHNATQ